MSFCCFGHRKNVGLEEIERDVQQRGILLDQSAVDGAVAGVHAQKFQLERHLAVAVQFLKKLGHQHAVLAAADADGDLVAGLHKLIPLDGRHKGRPQLFAVFFNDAALHQLAGR